MGNHRFLNQMSYHNEHSGCSSQGGGGDPRRRETSVSLLGHPVAKLREPEQNIGSRDR